MYDIIEINGTKQITKEEREEVNNMLALGMIGEEAIRGWLLIRAGLIDSLETCTSYTQKTLN